MVELEEFEPNRWRVKKDQLRPIRSNLPLPYVISDHMIRSSRLTVNSTPLKVSSGVLAAPTD